MAFIKLRVLMSKRYIYYNTPMAAANPYTLAFVAAMNALGIALLTSEIDALSDFEAEETAAGLIDFNNHSANNRKAIYVYLGGLAAGTKLNFLDPQDTDAAYRIDWSGGVTHVGGVTGNGVNGTGDTHYIPNAYGNDISISSYSVTTGNNGGADIVAYHSAGTSIVDIFSKWTDSKTYYSANATAEDDTSGLSGDGFKLSTSEGTTTQKLYQNGANVDSAAKTLGLPDRSVRILGMSGIGFSGRKLIYNDIGLEMNSTQVTAHNTAVQNLKTALGR